MFIACIVFGMVTGVSIAAAMAHESSKIELEYENSKNVSKSWL